MSKKRVAIVCGGRSSEHEISCISALGVLEAIDRDKFDPILIGISKEGAWLQLTGRGSFETGVDGLPMVPAAESEIWLGPTGLVDSHGAKIQVDLFFPILHGAYGEDGTIQGLFEMFAIPYVGSGVLASSVAMDKSFAKPIYVDFGMQVADGYTINQRDWLRNPEGVLEKITSLGFPLFIKPARSGSSRGTTKVHNVEGLSQALNLAFEHDPRILAETAIVGREIECAVLEVNGVPQASVLGEITIHPPHEFYDFEAKYLDGSTTFDYPANLSAALTAKIQESAITAFLALGCEGLARVDFFLTAKEELVINEVNTMPGFTPRSVFPMLWESSGKSYSQLITELCNGALARSKSVIR